jgi:YggT family protein
MALVYFVVRALLLVAWILILGRVILSWVDPGFERPISRSLYRLTEPVLAPIRGLLPRTGRLDLSPLVLLVGLSLLARLVLAL